MAERRKIGLNYKYDENWVGGTYYIENLVAALKVLPSSEQPELIIFADKEEEFTNLKNNTGYPNLHWHPLKKLSFLKRIFNKVYRIAYKQDYFFQYKKKLDLVFPTNSTNSFIPSQKFLYWIPDFQEHHLPHFFTEEEIANRKRYQRKITQVGSYIVFSSKSAQNDFQKFYPENKLAQFVLPFAVTHPAINNCQEIVEKYSIPKHFFICCNQLWKHKNHIVVIKALHLLKQQGQHFFVAFTGKEYDFRNPDYYLELTTLIEKLGLQENIKFLGFISRKDQLCLMKNAIAVIQPSLFEGWSTVIEDAKALQSKLIASTIDVHKEQLINYPAAVFFSAHKEDELASAMISVASLTDNAPGYANNVTAFAHKFKEIIDTITVAVTVAKS